MPAAGRMDGEVGCWGRVWINEGRLVTDGATSVDGCFNFSLPLYFLPILFIGPKYRNSFAAKLKAVIAFFSPPSFFSSQVFYSHLADQLFNSKAMHCHICKISL